MRPNLNERQIVPAPNEVGHKALAILAVLALSRMCVSFQFQSVTPVMAHLHESFSFNTVGFGMLLGLYMAPGAVTAIVEPILVKRLGGIATLLGGLALMALGQLGLVYASSMEVACFARLLSGSGGCLVYILTIDLAAQFCDAGRMPGRMGAIAASWPFGNAFSLVFLGLLVSVDLSWFAVLTPVVLILVAATLIMWRLPRSADSQCVGTSLNDWMHALSTSFAPGMVFALYNVSFILITSFSPQLLGSQGYSALSASNISSLPMWIFIVSVPIGGLLAGRMAVSSRVLAGLGCLGPAICLIASYYFQDKTVWYVLIGVLGGLPTGPMLTYVGQVVPRLFFAGIFFIFFIALLIFPPVVGGVIEATGEIRSVIPFSVILLLISFSIFIRNTRPRGSSDV